MHRIPKGKSSPYTTTNPMEPTPSFILEANKTVNLNILNLYILADKCIKVMNLKKLGNKYVSLSHVQPQGLLNKDGNLFIKNIDPVKNP